MEPLKLTIDSDRAFQRELEDEICQLAPSLNPEIVIRKAFDAAQTTALVISSADLLVNVLNLLITLRSKSPERKFHMTLENGNKKLEISSDQKIDAAEVTRQFFGGNTE